MKGRGNFSERRVSVPGMRILPIVSAALFVAGLSVAHAPVFAAESTEACMVYSEVSHNDTRSLDVKLASTCKKPMKCSVDWTITCGKTSNVTHNTAIVGADAEHDWVASAATCKEDWSISTTWRCDP